LKITECGDIEFYSKDKLQYVTAENVIKYMKQLRKITNVIEIKQADSNKCILLNNQLTRYSKQCIAFTKPLTVIKTKDSLPSMPLHL
jgi:hypothetical protein